MIRGYSSLSLLAALLLLVVSVSSYEKIEITRAQRAISLSGSYASENIKINFVANEDGINTFTYLTPIEYDDVISRISFTKTEKERSPFSFSKSTTSYVPVQ